MQRLDDYEETGIRCNVCSFEISDIDYRMYGRCCVLHAEFPIRINQVGLFIPGFRENPLGILIHNALLKMRRKVERGCYGPDELSTRMNLILSWSGCYNITDANTVWKKLRLLWNITKVARR